MNDAARRAFWLQQGATAGEAAELTAYAQSGFEPGVFARVLECPLADEPFVGAWQQYVRAAEEIGAAASLRRPLIQLRFPVADGMSASPAYLAAVRRGVFEGDTFESGVAFAQPDAIRIFIHPTAAGQVPVIVAGAREDFVSLVQAVTCRNEPAPIPAAMGACIVAGYNNWDRSAALGPLFPGASIDKSLYQDRFIILSSGPYSGVSAADVAMPSEDAWRRLSLTIRLEHECAHYVTRHALGTMRNSILDELIADYTGIVAATGRYDAAWFLRFLGLDAGGCRAGGRIHTYRGAPALSDRAFAILCGAVRTAAIHLEAFDASRYRNGWLERARMIVAIALTGLEALASAEGCNRLGRAAADAARIVRDRSRLYSIETGV